MTDAELDHLQNRVAEAHADLRLYLIKQCPGKHNYVQHRDGWPPWCESCRRTSYGYLKERNPERDSDQ